jgi:hypothetical protein
MDYKGEWGEGALDTPGPFNGTALETEDILSTVPEGRESAETTMNQEEASTIWAQECPGPPPPHSPK